jgi:hypothetical protein
VRFGERLLAEHGGLPGLARLTLPICAIYAAWVRQAAQIVAATEIGHRLCSATSEMRLPISIAPADVRGC